MADEDDGNKTEEPTQKRLDDAREKGQVASSREINHWFMFLGAAMAMFMFGPSMLRDFDMMLIAFLESPHAIPLDSNAFTNLMWWMAVKIGMILWPTVLLLMVAAVAAGY